MGLKKITGIILLLMVLLFSSPLRVSAATLSEVSKEFICQCGCNMVLLNCSHGECASRTAMNTIVGQKLDQGLTKEEIVQFFVAEYGEQVLASPPKKGFNLVAWIMPFAAILAGGLVIYLVLKKWVFQGRLATVAPTAISKEKEEEYRRRVEKELTNFAEKGFR